MTKSKVLISEEPEEPHRSKTLLYLAFGLAVTGAIMMFIPTVFIFVPGLVPELSWSTFYKLPIFWVLVAGFVILTAGLILHRKITKPMRYAEMEKLKSRLE
ncbi:MAG: hypothetical protein ACTSXO_08920 [Candidatus Heimdallarchaeota archaeon]